MYTLWGRHDCAICSAHGTVQFIFCVGGEQQSSTLPGNVVGERQSSLHIHFDLRTPRSRKLRVTLAMVEDFDSGGPQIKVNIGKWVSRVWEIHFPIFTLICRLLESKASTVFGLYEVWKYCN